MPASAPISLDSLSAAELLDYATGRGYRPFLHDGLFLVNTLDGQATPLTDLLYRRADELLLEMARRALVADEQARLEGRRAS